MKNLVIGILTLLPIILPQARAELHLDKPSDLMAKAQQSRIACREVILDISQNVPEMRDAATFDSYFVLLPTLEQISQSVNLDEIYPDAVKSLGLKMVSNGVRWLSITTDTPEKILAYHRWMSMDIVSVFQANIDLAARDTQDPVALKKLASNTEYLMALADKNFPTNIDLRLGYRRILSDLAAKFVNRNDLSEEDRIYWLGKISLPNGFAAALDSMQTDVLALNQTNKTSSHTLSKRILAIAANVKKASSDSPLWLTNQVSDVALSVITKNVDLQEPFADGEFTALLDVLTTRSLQNLSQQWVNMERVPDAGYINHYLDLTRLLLGALKKNNFDKEVTDLTKFEEKLAAPIVVASKKLEGTYAVTDPKGKKWTFTIALARQALIYAELADNDGFIRKAFFNISYGVEDDAFVGSEREVDLDPSHNFTVRFKLSADGKIEVRDLMAQPEIQNLKGKKIESYPDYFPQTQPNAVNPSGTYKGVINIAPDYKRPITLIVTGFNGYTLGRATDDAGYVTLDLNMGTRATDSVLYLTTGRMHSSHWVQLRGRIIGDTFRGFTINGGRGISKTEFILKKVLD